MKKQMVKLLGIVCVPVGALFFNGCGPENMNESDLALEEQASDNWIFLNGAYSEWGHCNNAQDDNGDGLVDSADPDCHINPGPIRDLSVLDFPIGHNFFPDVTRDIPGGPGYLGNFRDPALITRWFRFLTEADGNTAGVNLMYPGTNPEIVPVPAMLPALIRQGTWHLGNNNNVSTRSLHVYDLFDPLHVPVPPSPAAAAAAAAQAPASDVAAATQGNVSSQYQQKVYKHAIGASTGGMPGWFYDATNSPFGGTGSQGGVRPARTGNPD